MCAIISISELQYEAFELLEENEGALATRCRAAQIETEWEMDAYEVPVFDVEAKEPVR